MTPQTHVPTEVLRTLHRIQRQLTDLRERLRRGPNLVRAHESNVKRLEDQAEKAQANSKALRAATNSKQRQLDQREAKVEDLRRKLNEANSNKEYQALVEQIAATEQANSVLTDEILEAMDKVDESREEVARAEGALAKAREEAEKVCRKVQQQEPLVQADIRRLEDELQQSETALPSEFRASYRRVVQARGEDALAPMEGEFCGGCHQHVPINMCNALTLSQPVFCKSCGRLLYLPEGHSLV